MSERKTLGLKRHREADPAPKAEPAPTPAAAEPESAPKAGGFTWKCQTRLARRIRALGVAPGGFVHGVVTSAVRNGERRAAGEREDLTIVGVPAGTGDRMARAVEAAGLESVSEWATAVLLAALDDHEAKEEEAS